MIEHDSTKVLGVQYCTVQGLRRGTDEIKLE